VSKTRFGGCDVGRTLAISVRCPDTVRPLVQMLLVRRWSKAFRSTSLLAMPRFRSEVDMAAWRFGCCEQFRCMEELQSNCFPLREQLQYFCDSGARVTRKARPARVDFTFHRCSNLDGSCLTISFWPATHALWEQCSSELRKRLMSISSNIIYSRRGLCYFCDDCDLPEPQASDQALSRQDLACVWSRRWLCWRSASP
jgi:hypothetical protein